MSRNFSHTKVGSRSSLNIFDKIAAVYLASITQVLLGQTSMIKYQTSLEPKSSIKAPEIPC